MRRLLTALALLPTLALAQKPLPTEAEMLAEVESQLRAELAELPLAAADREYVVACTVRPTPSCSQERMLQILAGAQGLAFADDASGDALAPMDPTDGAEWAVGDDVLQVGETVELPVFEDLFPEDDAEEDAAAAAAARRDAAVQRHRQAAARRRRNGGAPWPQTLPVRMQREVATAIVDVRPNGGAASVARLRATSGVLLRAVRTTPTESTFDFLLPRLAVHFPALFVDVVPYDARGRATPVVLAGTVGQYGSYRLLRVTASAPEGGPSFASFAVRVVGVR